MHLIRRSAFRAISSPSTSFISKSRSLTTASPFLIRSKPQSLTSINFRRFASNDVASEAQENTASIPSADAEDSSVVRSAIESASESASTYTPEAAEQATESFSNSEEAIVDAAKAAGAAAGLSAPPRSREVGGRGNDRQERRRPEQADVLPSNSIYVGNLSFEISEADLAQEFATFGEVKNTIIATDARGMSKGFGYVQFDSTPSATAAIEAKHQSVFEGRRIIVNYQVKSDRQNRPKAEPSKTLYIGNLAFEMSDADLNKMFRDIKNVIDVRVAIDRRTGQPRGFAHADFVDVESAVKGLEALQGQEVYGRVLRVDFSGGPATRQPREGGFGGDRYGGDRSRGDRSRGDRYGGDRYGGDRYSGDRQNRPSNDRY